MPTGWIVISGPSTSTEEFGLCIVGPTTFMIARPDCLRRSGVVFRPATNGSPLATTSDHQATCRKA
jgi:hypothetical protein